MKKNAILPITLLFLLINAFANDLSKDEQEVVKTIEKMNRAKTPSKSSGTLRDGSLINSSMLPEDGVGYYLAHPKRGSNFGSDRLVYGLMQLGARLKSRLGDQKEHLMRVHDLSIKNGGKILRHINHQMGMDVDIALYATNYEGKIVETRWRSFNDKGKSVNGEYLFDTARNWEIVEGIIENRYFGEIRALLIADHLKLKLLDFAKLKLKSLKLSKEKSDFELIIERADKLMRQPGSSPHDNHFHLSLKIK